MHCKVPTCMLQPFQPPALQGLPAAYLHLVQAASGQGGLHKRFKGGGKASLEGRGQQQVGNALRHGGRLRGGQVTSALGCSAGAVHVQLKVPLLHLISREQLK